jgi:hypothetical protein
MINVEELRIGNYVMYNGIVVRVYGIIPPAPNADDYWNDVWILELFEGASTITARLEDISAIDFDADWVKKLKLRKVTWKENVYGRYVTEHSHWFEIGRFPLSGGSIWIEDKQHSLFDFVHELQNITYWMTKKELIL